MIYVLDACALLALTPWRDRNVRIIAKPAHRHIMAVVSVRANGSELSDESFGEATIR